MATENLKVKITADASQAKAEIGKFKDSLKGLTQTGETATRSIGKTTAALAGALIALKAVKGAIKNAINVATTGDALKDNAQKVFMTTTAYQEWGYVLKQNGIEVNSLKTAMRQFAPQVAAGSDALKRYGITSTDTSRAFEQAIYTIQNMSTETEKITAATELFGSRALELFPILNMTNAETQSLMNTYRALGGTMSNELIAASDTCADSITAMKAAWGGLRNVLAQYFLPIITKVVRWITIAIAYVRILLSAIFGLKSSFGGVGNKKTSLPATTGSVATNMGNTAKNLKKATKHAKELRRTLMGIDELSRLTEQATAAAASPSSAGGGGGGGSVGGGGFDDIGGIENLLDQETLDRLEKFQKRIDEIKEGFSLIFDGIGDLFHGDWESGLNKIKEGIEKVFPGIKNLKEKWEDLKEHVKDITANIKAAIASKWADLKAKWEAIVDNVKDKVAAMKASVASKWADLKAAWAGIVDNVKDKIADMKAAVATKWNDIKEKWKNVVDNIKDKAADMKATVATKWSDIKTKWHNVVDNIQAKTVDMKAKVASKWSDLRARWNGLLAKFKGKTVDIGLKFSAVAQDLKNWINNHVFAKINSVFAKVPILNNYQLKLAKGGVLTAPTTALMAEYPGARSNPEIVTPQSIMYETMMRANGEALSAQAEIGRQIIAAIERQSLEVKIGDETIARSAQRGNVAYRKRTGKGLITV